MSTASQPAGGAIPRFFVRHRQLAWVLLACTLAWGAYGYRSMPQRKDPLIPVRVAVAIAPWPGVGAERIEELVTRRVEEVAAENAHVERVESTTRTSVAIVYVRLEQDVAETGKEFDDIKIRLDGIRDLPEGAGPITFIKDFGDTAALMLTVASPPLPDLEVGLRARAIESAIRRERAGRSAAITAGRAVTIVYGFPQSLDVDLVRKPFAVFAGYASAHGLIDEGRVFEGPGFMCLDGTTRLADADLQGAGDRFIQERLRQSEFHPDSWPALLVHDPGETARALAAVAPARYTYRELDDYTSLIKRTLQRVPSVSKITRAGVLGEAVYLEDSQERLASYGVRPAALAQVLGARNIAAAGGVLEVGGKNITIDPTGQFRSEREIGEVLVPTANGRPLYLRDLVDVARGYESPARFLNFLNRRGPDGRWQRLRAVTLAVQMRAGEKIGDFGVAVDTALADLRTRLPEDLVLARTSDQPRQVTENIDLFMQSLYEAIGLVVLVSLIGFWDWRSAVLMAISIPITLAMTFGMMQAFGIDLQQVSIASLILALGLLVDVPVVAGDAIRRELAAGRAPADAAWLGPTRLRSAMTYATITNIVAYLPFLVLSGDKGRFLHAMPIVIACSLVASLIVALTLIPLVGYYLLKPRREATLEERRQRGFPALYYRVGGWAIDHRWLVLAGSLLFLVLGGVFQRQLRTQFFPTDLSYLSYVDVWLPEDATLASTRATARRVEEVIEQATAEFGRTHPGDRGEPRAVLQSLTTFVGGGGPRFWFSVAPEISQLNYAQVLIEVKDKHDTPLLAEPLQLALSRQIAGARVDVRQLETGAPVGIPIQVRLSGEHIPTLRRFADDVAATFRGLPGAARVRDNWGSDSVSVRLAIDPDRANLAGVTNLDVALSSAAGMNGFTVARLREGTDQIPVVARLRMEERAQLTDLQNLYVYSATSLQKVPLGLISSIGYGTQVERIARRQQFRTISVAAFPGPGRLPSQVLNAAMPALRDIERRLPPGYRLEIGGEYEEQVKGFRELATVMALSVGLIFLALAVQFRHAVKPFIVFAAIPYGAVGALAALWMAGAPFGFMAFLGIASLVGVIVSHIIVLFDFIEEKRAEGEPLRQALLDAGIIRLRPVLITVLATVIALVPLARHGGPLWEPLCYAQIGGLLVATFITLLLVPVIYALVVQDLRIVRWEREE